MSERLPFESVLDLCVQQIVSGTATVEQCLARYPDHREELEPALRTAFELASAPRPAAPQPDPTRREAFMALIRETPQDPPRPRRIGGVRLPSMPRLRAPSFADWGGFSLGGLGLGALALRTVPAAAVALLAVAVVSGVFGRPSSASAATLTVFAGEVEQQVDGAWQPLEDGASLGEGDAVRTLEGSHALLTFPDGSTASLAQGTQVSLIEVSVGEARRIELDQASGRLWNDVVPITGSDTYLVRTPHATVQAHGTVFETLVDSETEVSTVEGLVRVISAGSSVDVETGQVVRANADRIATPEAIPFVGEITVRAPLAAALTSADGAATGLLPSGVVFRQVPGVTTTGAREAQQHMYVGDVTPGVYSLWLRRYAEGDGIVVLETADGRLNIPVPANVQTARVLIAIDIVDGSVFMRALDTEVETVPDTEVPSVRVVPSNRTRAAVDLGAARHEREATASATATDETTPTATRATDTPTATATPSRAPIDAYALELRAALDEALRTRDNTRLEAVLDRLLDGNDEEDRARVEALAEVMQDPDARVRIAAVLLVGVDDDLRDDLADVLRDLDRRGQGRGLSEALEGLWDDDDRDRDDRGRNDRGRNDDDRRGNDRGDDRDDDRGNGRNDERGNDNRGNDPGNDNRDNDDRGNDDREDNRGRGNSRDDDGDSGRGRGNARDDDERGGWRGATDDAATTTVESRDDGRGDSRISQRERSGGLAELIERWRERLAEERRGGR